LSQGYYLYYLLHHLLFLQDVSVLQNFITLNAANQSVSGHTPRIFLYRSSRTLFLFYLTITIINIPNVQGKSKSLKNSIEYIVLSIESRNKKEDRKKVNKYSFSFLATPLKFTLIKIGSHPIFLMFFGKFITYTYIFSYLS